MFCKSCGTKIEGEAKFCPSCGAALGENAAVTEKPTAIENAQVEAQNTNAESAQKSAQSTAKANQEILITGTKCSGEAASRFFGTTSWMAYAIPYLIIWIFFGGKMTSIAEGLLARCGLTLVFTAPFYPVVLYLLRKYCKKTVSYNENEKRFYFNENSKLPFTKTLIELDKIKGIRYRNLKFTFFDKFFKGAETYQAGTYYVVAFDFEEEASWDVWFSEKSEAEKFLTIVESALKANNQNIEINKNEELVEYVDYVNELAENKEELKEFSLKRLKLLRSCFKFFVSFLIAVGLLILVVAIVAIVNNF